MQNEGPLGVGAKSKKTNGFDKSNAVDVAASKEWLASKPFEKAPLQKSNSSESIQSLNSKLHGTVQARKEWLAHAFTDRGSKSDTFDVSRQWELAIKTERVQGEHTPDDEESISSDATNSTEADKSQSEPSTDETRSPSTVTGDPSDTDSAPGQELHVFNDDKHDPCNEQILDASGLTTSHYSQAGVCVVLVQAVVRGYLLRCQAQRFAQAATKIQSQVRRVQGEEMYELQRFAIVLLQSWTRGQRVRNHLERLRSVVLIQSAARGWLVRNSFERSFASVLLQSVVRGWLIRKHEKEELTETTRCAAVQLQKHWRRYQVQSMYELQKFAVVFIQAVTRGWLVRCHAARAAAETSCWENDVDRAVCRIQRHWRRYQVRQSLGELKILSVIRLQSVFRVFLVQKRLEKTYAAALLQSLVRGWLTRTRMEHTLAAAFIQSVTRGWLVRRKLHESMSTNRDAAATLIQSRWRQYVARSMYEMQSLAIVIIQSVVRVFLVQKQLEKTYAAAFLQAVTRGWLVRVQLEKTFAAAMLQAIVRGWLARILLKKLRGYKSLADTQRRHQAMIVLIQSHWRRRVVLFRYEKQCTSAIVIQSVVRVFLVQKRLEKIYAVAFLQSVTRGWLVRRRMERTFAAVLVQSMIRGRLIRKEVERSRREYSAVLIQRQWKRFQARSIFELEMFAVRLLQAVIRGHLTRKTMKRVALLAAIVKLQGLVRGRQARSRVQVYKDYVTTSSRTAGTHEWHTSQRTIFQQTFLSAMLLHSFARGIHSSNNSVADGEPDEGSVTPTHIQAAQRGRALLLDHHLRLESASVIQVWCKRVIAHRARVRTFNEVRAAVRIQSTWRRFGGMIRFRGMARSAITIQSWFRSLLNIFKTKRSAAATLIQARWRGCMEKEAYEFYKLMVKSATVVQAAWREFMTRKARVRRSLLALSPNRGHHYVRRQFLFNSSYSLVSVTPSSPSSVTVFTSSDYSVLYTPSEVSQLQPRSESTPSHTSPTQRKKPASITLDLSNPKSRLAPVLTWFGVVNRPTTKRMSAARAATSIQKIWRGHSFRHQRRQAVASVKLIQAAALKFLKRRKCRARRVGPASNATKEQPDHASMLHSYRAPYATKVALQRRSFLLSARAPVLTWF